MCSRSDGKVKTTIQGELMVELYIREGVFGRDCCCQPESTIHDLATFKSVLPREVTRRKWNNPLAFFTHQQMMYTHTGELIVMPALIGSFTTCMLG